MCAITLRESEEETSKLLQHFFHTGPSHLSLDNALKDIVAWEIAMNVMDYSKGCE